MPPEGAPTDQVVREWNKELQGKLRFLEAAGETVLWADDAAVG